jgi:hypothetical protein
LIAAFSCGVEALMFGSLMMFASGVVTSSPSSASASGTRCSSLSSSGNWERIRAAREMSRSSTSTPAAPAKASMIGRNEWVASAGASSV